MTPLNNPAVPSPTLLRGHAAIGAHLRIGNREVAHLDRQRRLPTFRWHGVLCATVAALDDWRTLTTSATD